MQVFKEKKKKSHADTGKNKPAEAQRTNTVRNCMASKERQRLLELANEAGLRAKRKAKQEKMLLGSVVGAAAGVYMMVISATTTTCKGSVSNPYLLVAGAVVAAIGVGLFLYFGSK
jgi:hypothetical protein